MVVDKRLVALEKAAVVGVDSTGHAWFGLAVVRMEEVRSVVGLLNGQLCAQSKLTVLLTSVSISWRS